MNKQLTYILWALLCCMSFAARGAEVPAGYEYRPLVEEGKTWWYTYQEFHVQNWPERHEFGIRIKGDSVVDGVVWKKVLYVNEDLTEDRAVRCLLREESKTVYYKSGQEEGIIYDFNVDEGSTFVPLWYPDGEPDNDYFGGAFAVSAVGYVDRSDMIFKTFTFDNDWTGRTTAVEGVGVIDNEYTFDLPFTPKYDAYPRFIPVLRWVTDADYGIYYEAKGGFRLWETPGQVLPAGYPYRPMDEVGTTWWYTSSRTTGGVTETVEFGIELCDSIEGSPRCVLVGPDLKRDPRSLGVISEYGRVVRFESLIERYSGTGFPPQYLADAVTYPAPLAREAVIYDFSWFGGDSYTIPGTNEAGLIHKVDYVENSGRIYKMYDYDGSGNFACADGIGNIAEGQCFMTPFAWCDAGDGLQYRLHLRWVTDADRNVIFENLGGVKLWEADGVDDVKVLGGLELRAAGAEVWIAGAAEACVAVADMAGRTVVASAVAEGSRLSLADLPAGVYVVTAVAADGSRATVKLVRSFYSL